MKWETVVSTKKLTIDMGILPSSGEYIVRVFLDRKPIPYSWKAKYSRVEEVSYSLLDVPPLLKKLIDTIPKYNSKKRDFKGRPLIFRLK